MSDEIWKSVVSFDGFFKDHYEVSNLGRVRRLGFSDCRIVAQSAVRGGYATVHLCVNNQRRRLTVHKLVLEAFVGPCPPDCEALHGPNGSTDNSLDNLRWGSRKENVEDRKRDGRQVGKSTRKLTAEDVSVIRRRLEAGDPASAIMTDYDIGWQSVYNIRHRKSWKHVE